MTDAGNSVYEQTFDVNLNPDAPHDIDGNNFKPATYQHVLHAAGGLEVTKVVAPAAAASGDTITVTWTVANNGSVQTARDNWADAIYLSTSDNLYNGSGQHWRVFGVPHVGRLQVGSRTRRVRRSCSRPGRWAAT